MKLISVKTALILIVLLAAAVRFIGLSHLPPALNRDEAAIGYNAYSLLKTGRDEHGQFLPLAFKSIGDYKMPLYIYATAIPVKLFGLNDFSIRFWSALAGLLSVVFSYLIVLKLTKKTLPAVLTAVLFTFNPWAVFFSRIGFEANLALALFLAGLYCLLRGMKKYSLFIVGLLLLLLSFLTYSSSLIFIPILLSVFFFIFRRQLNRKKVISLFVFSAIFILIFKSLWSISAQKSNITVFSNPTVIHQYNETRTRIYQQNPLLARTWWNKNVYFLRIITGNYLKTFSPEFLLTVGGNHPWHRTPNIGNFYYLEIFFALVGIYWLIKHNKNNQLKALLITWLLVSPLPSAITIDAPHSTRSLYLLPVMIILSALGINYFYSRLKSRSSLFVLLVGLYLLNLSFFSLQYLFVYPRQFPAAIPLGLKQNLKFIQNLNLSGNIYLKDIHSSTYLYPLVYLQFDPSSFQSQAVWTKPDLTGLTNAYKFVNYSIIDNPADMIDPQAVIWPESEKLDNPGLKKVFSSQRYSLYLKE